MAMTIEPCPFCGGEPQVRIPTERDGFAAHVMCRCGAQLYGHKRHFASEQEAVEAWNRRTHLTQPAQAVDVGAVGVAAECYIGEKELEMLRGLDSQFMLKKYGCGDLPVDEDLDAEIDAAIDATQEGEAG